MRPGDTANSPCCLSQQPGPWNTHAPVTDHTTPVNTIQSLLVPLSFLNIHAGYPGRKIVIFYLI